MKRLALAAVGAAVVGLTACSGGAAHTTGSAGRPAASSRPPTTTAVSCSRQFHTWRDSHGKGLLAAFHAVSMAGRSADAHQLTVALKRAQPAVARATRHPVPACADPRGYWSVLLMHVNAAVTGKASAASARAAMQDVPVIEHRLMVELRRSSGS
jgi:hypothetical protein